MPPIKLINMTTLFHARKTRMVPLSTKRESLERDEIRS